MEEHFLDSLAGQSQFQLLGKFLDQGNLWLSNSQNKHKCSYTATKKAR